jgi:hypothetical protein
MISHIKSNFLLILCVLFFFSCAAQGTASGGPEDKEGPIITKIEPENKSLHIEKDTPITIYFNEMVDPVSIPSSVMIENQTYRVKIRSKKIIIIPEEEWENQSVIRIDISRNIRDYQGNTMQSPSQFIFSTGQTIPTGSISGSIVNIDSNKVSLVGLFQYPIQDSIQLVRKTESSKFGNFSFDFLTPGNYFILGVEGNLDNPLENIRQFRYSMMMMDSIQVIENQELPPIKMFLHYPIEHKQIQSIELINQSFGIAELNDGTQLQTILVSHNSTPYMVGDSVAITKTLENSVETYTTKPFQFIMPEIVDTLPPVISSSYTNSSEFVLEFNEPIIIENQHVFGFVDSNAYQFSLMENTPLQVFISHLPDSITSVEILPNTFSDYYSNFFPDSTINIPISHNISSVESSIGGNILGSVDFDTQVKIGIEAINDLTKVSYFSTVKNGTFRLENLPSGFYTLWAYEKLNELHHNAYFPGTLEPYKRASKFVFYPDKVEVRARWDIEGIDIKYLNNIEEK